MKTKTEVESRMTETKVMLHKYTRKCATLALWQFSAFSHFQADGHWVPEVSGVWRFVRVAEQRQNSTSSSHVRHGLGQGSTKVQLPLLPFVFPAMKCVWVRLTLFCLCSLFCQERQPYRSFVEMEIHCHPGVRDLDRYAEFHCVQDARHHHGGRQPSVAEVKSHFKPIRNVLCVEVDKGNVRNDDAHTHAQRERERQTNRERERERGIERERAGIILKRQLHCSCKQCRVWSPRQAEKQWIWWLTSKCIFFICSAFITLIETGDEYKWKGYSLAVILFFTGTIFGICIHYSVMTRQRADLRVKTALTAAIYRKVSKLRLTPGKELGSMWPC